MFWGIKTIWRVVVVPWLRSSLNKLKAVYFLRVNVWSRDFFWVRWEALGIFLGLDFCPHSIIMTEDDSKLESKHCSSAFIRSSHVLHVPNVRRRDLLSACKFIWDSLARCSHLWLCSSYGRARAMVMQPQGREFESRLSHYFFFFIGKDSQCLNSFIRSSP